MSTNSGRITAEGVDTLRSRIGIPYRHPSPPHYRRANRDAFRAVSEACGDDNPLWCDADYATKSRWGEPIAPPTLVGGDTLIGEEMMTEADIARQEDLKGDPLRGVHAFYAASEREWWAPLSENRAVQRRTALVGVLDKSSDFGGRGIHEWSANLFADADGPLLGAQYRLMIRAEREQARERSKNAAIEPYVWSEKEIAEIDAAYASEKPRGSVPRWFEDVQIGDSFHPLTKGPLTVTDMIVWHSGVGMGIYGVGALRLAYKHRQRMPRFFHRDPQGIWDVMQRVHWDPEFARKSGNPTTFDYGRMRENWLIHACTDWMGDDAWLMRLRVEFRKFNYVGDLQVITGTITDKRLIEDGAGIHPAVDVDLVSTNQRGEVTAPGSATILLPSREHGPVALPVPIGGSRNLDEALAASVEHFAAR